MTLYHFGNCLALIYVPYHMAYKYSGISEYSSLGKCVHAGGLYLVTQLLKMLLLATFFPDTDSRPGATHPADYDVMLEILKATVDLMDLVGLHLAMAAVPGKGHAKILTAAIGWASAEVLVSRLVPLWTGARGAEFSWRHLVAAGQSNVALLSGAAIATLVWLAARRLPQGDLAVPLAAILCLLVPYRGVAEDILSAALGLSPAQQLALRATAAAALAAAATALYAKHATVY